MNAKNKELKKIKSKKLRVKEIGIQARTLFWASLITLNAVEIGIPNIILGNNPDVISLIIAALVTFLSLWSIFLIISNFQKHTELHNILEKMYNDEYKARENSSDDSKYKNEKKNIKNNVSEPIKRITIRLNKQESMAKWFSIIAACIIIIGFFIKWLIVFNDC